MMYRVNAENHLVRAGKPAMGVPHGQREALYIVKVLSRSRSGTEFYRVCVA